MVRLLKLRSSNAGTPRWDLRILLGVLVDEYALPRCRILMEHGTRDACVFRAFAFGQRLVHFSRSLDVDILLAAAVDDGGD